MRLRPAACLSALALAATSWGTGENSLTNHELDAGVCNKLLEVQGPHCKWLQADPATSEQCMKPGGMLQFCCLAGFVTICTMLPAGLCSTQTASSALMLET